MQNDHDNGAVSSPVIAPARQFGDTDTVQKKNEHMARGIAHRERGEYVRAIDEFAEACRLASLTHDYEWQECDDNLERMLFVLHCFFNPEVDPESFRFWEGEPLPETTLRDLAANTNIPPSHLMVGGNYVFASYPLTEVGRAEAIEHARYLAHEGMADRHKYPGVILGDVPDFPMNVYRYERQPIPICWFHYC